jgi:predicted dehydrogenase
MIPVNVGVVGCGKISDAYLQASATFPVLNITACADLALAAAQALGSSYDLEVLSVDALLQRPEIEVVLNLTIPVAHAEVNLAALAAGKHAYCEKPFGLDTAEGRGVLAAAEEAGLRVGCAPDTFLGGSHQTVRGLIDDGAIGRLVAGTAFMMGSGHESWHPSPDFYYQPGGGPMFDMGPYYISALVNALGAVKSVAAIGSRAYEVRTIGSEPRAGETIAVEVDTHLAGTLEFHSGALVTLVMSFDVIAHGHSHIEIYGTEGTLIEPSPNGFGGAISIAKRGDPPAATPDQRWRDLPLSHGHAGALRSIGLADMCAAIRLGRDHRCSGELGFHVLEIMAAFDRSSRERQRVEIESHPQRPAPLLASLVEGELDPSDAAS